MPDQVLSAKGLGALAAAVAIAIALAAPHDTAAQNSKSVTIVLSAEPESLDGCNANRSTSGPVIKENIFETLTSISAKDGSMEPRLATSWERIDPTTWRFKLRDGVTFHDGSPFDAEAAVFGIRRTLETQLDCETRYRQLGDVKISGRAVDRLTLDIVTNKPEPILPMRMAVLAFVSPKTSMQNVSLQPVGTGPYVFDHYTAGQEVVLKRNEKYWGPKPAVEIGRFVWRAESAVRAAMVAIGEADFANSISQGDANNPATDVSYLNSETLRQRIDGTQPPLDDKRIRLALNYAVDRNAIRGTILPKEVIPANQIVGPTVAGHNHDLDKTARGYDPAKARQLIAEAKAAGAPIDRELQVIGRINQYPGANELVEALASMYRSVGFNVKVRNLEVAEYLDTGKKPYAENRGPVLRDEKHDNRTDPVFSMFNKYACEGQQSALCNPDTDKLIAKASASSGEERVKAWQEVFRNIYEDNVSEVWLFHIVGYARVSPRIKFLPNIKTTSEVALSEIAFR